MKEIIKAITCTALLFASTVTYQFAFAASPDQEKSIYGWQVMTKKERADYLKMMQDIKNEEDREMLRIEHEEMMQDRARAKGIKLPGM